jgi:hypothetical protein
VKARNVSIPILAAVVATAFALSVLPKSDSSSTAIAQTATSVSCYPLSCFASGYSPPYAEQCTAARTNYAKNKRDCENIFNNNATGLQNCVQALDSSVNKPCTCASQCSRAVCTKWSVGNRSCVTAEWR